MLYNYYGTFTVRSHLGFLIPSLPLTGSDSSVTWFILSFDSLIIYIILLLVAYTVYATAVHFVYLLSSLIYLKQKKGIVSFMYTLSFYCNIIGDNVQHSKLFVYFFMG